MAFLENSGDIILDAVLTDEGRRKLAEGNGSFNITKFALGDDEVDYGLYNANHTSGSAYYDLQILQTPVLEGFTDAGSSLKSSLITYLDNTKFYLPVLRLNDKTAGFKTAVTTGSFLIATTEATRDKFASVRGVIDGFEPAESSTTIRVDQGLDTGFEISPSVRISAEDRETTYTIFMDNRLGVLADKDGSLVTANFVDDDNIASYTVTRATATELGNNIVEDNLQTRNDTENETIQGPRGTTLRFRIGATFNLQRSNYLFNNIGSTSTLVESDETTNTSIRIIDTMIKVVGGTTGYTIDIPVRFFKKSDE